MRDWYTNISIIHYLSHMRYSWGFLDGSLVKKKKKKKFFLPMQEKWVRSLCQEDSLEEGNHNPFQYSFFFFNYFLTEG